MKPIAQLSAILFPLFAATAMAVDGPHFTITVPLALSNLPPEVNQYRVGCVVIQTGTGITGRAETTGSISGGGFSGNVSVPITVTTPNNPGLVDSYYCSLHLFGTIDGRRYTFLDDSNTRFPLAAGAPFLPRIENALPR